MTIVPEMALAATTTTSGGANVIASAIAAYVHYFSLLGMAALLSLERSLIKPDMSDDEQQLFTMADVGVGLNSIPLLVSGYFCVSPCTVRGGTFINTKPLFWLKLGLVGITFSASIFVTIKVIQRSVLQAQSGEWPRMTEKLASRIKTLVTAELLALFSIPLAPHSWHGVWPIRLSFRGKPKPPSMVSL